MLKILVSGKMVLFELIHYSYNSDTNSYYSLLRYLFSYTDTNSYYSDTHSYYSDTNSYYSDTNTYNSDTITQIPILITRIPNLKPFSYDGQSNRSLHTTK